MTLKRFSVFLLALLLVAPAAVEAKTVHVRGHYTKSGKYVHPHTRTAPDHSKSNNWSAKGNVNPNTGKSGHVAPK